ncbi:MAG: hypothetical protein ICV78_06645 [Tolypothrix sp. Co-bin9]|nr:hypothetical protein [Tolypothrix sp. Co-bin9]
MKILPIPGLKLELWNRTSNLQLSWRSLSLWEKVQRLRFKQQMGFLSG